MNEHSKKYNRTIGAIWIIGVILLIVGYAIWKKNYNTPAIFISNSKESMSSKEKEPKYKFRKDGELKFYSSSQEKSIKIDIEVADNFKAHTIGLMYRKEMLDSQGMLFVFDKEGPHSFWMKNTYIALDIIYLNDDREIVDVYMNADPKSTIGLPSKSPARYVLETVAGFSAYHQLRLGDKLEWTVF